MPFHSQDSPWPGRIRKKEITMLAIVIQRQDKTLRHKLQ